MQGPQNEIRTQPRPRCFLCNSAGEVLYTNLHDPFFDAPGKWDFKKCPKPDCGLVWLDPAPVSEDLHLAYERYFTHGHQDGQQGNGSGMREILYRCYLTGSSLPGAVIGLQKSKGRMACMFLDDQAPGKVLDVGCGDGRFLSRMRGRGWTVDGLDFDKKAIKCAKTKYGLDLRHGDLHSVRFPDASFDAVTLSHVIEHVPDPVELLKEVRRILKPGGRFVITTPNNESFGHKKFQTFWFGLDQPRHLQVFSLGALRHCAERSGLKVTEACSSAANADTFIGASYSIRDSENHRSSHHPPPSINRTVKAMLAQYRQHLSLSKTPRSGEEAVLIGTRS